MNNDFNSPIWTQYRGRFAANIATLVRDSLTVLDHGFARLTARRFAAPWERQHVRDTRFSAFR
ncbi:hypothetical protein ACFO8O_12860 [Hephaestia sp. GCM10023244]|uniref:hypothetical protein n=1 Tax=unclassified Hephaestia TaxID=2631281 RepID=UPI0020774C3A|nr:hypothetical protein [Hephaestia sp. MAHUQ-44]MCM8731851.1 hypothetical protein [Hephaestia sp. MAHUQ-44]